MHIIPTYINNTNNNNNVEKRAVHGDRDYCYTSTLVAVSVRVIYESLFIIAVYITSLQKPLVQKYFYYYFSRYYRCRCPVDRLNAIRSQMLLALCS